VIGATDAAYHEPVSIDVRTRRYADLWAMSRDQMVDEVLPQAIAVHGELAARGVTHRELPPLGLDVDGRQVTLATSKGTLALEPGTDRAGVVVQMGAEALSDLVQDAASTMGLAMKSRLQITEGSLDDWVGWEPPLRALLDGRRVHEPGDVTFVDAAGDPLDLATTFTLDDDRAEMSHFLHVAGFLHLRQVFSAAEMADVEADLDASLARAQPDDGASWWAEDGTGRAHPVRVLWFHERSEALRRLLDDERVRWLAGLTGDDFDTEHRSAEGLVKPLDIVKGLSDLPWHKDCGQGHHSYMCNSLTAGISVTGADRTCGALGVIPGSHRANTVATMRDRRLDLRPRLLETAVGDMTVHCSDTLHRAHPPVDRARKVVYSSFRLRPLPGDALPETPQDAARRARAQLSDVTDRIEAADNPASDARYRARSATPR